MNPTLEDCNDVLDWIDNNFDFGKELRARVREADDSFFVMLTWRGTSGETRTLFAARVGNGRLVD